jgi:hypothetical protein
MLEITAVTFVGLIKTKFALKFIEMAILWCGLV